MKFKAHKDLAYYYLLKLSFNYSALILCHLVIHDLVQIQMLYPLR